jgi:hypothetical protein
MAARGHREPAWRGANGKGNGLISLFGSSPERPVNRLAPWLMLLRAWWSSVVLRFGQDVPAEGPDRARCEAA